MEIFLLKSKVYRYFEFKYLTLFMILIQCSWTQDNIPSFNVTCNSTGLYVKIAFSKPFSGIAYAKGYRFDPLCSMTESSALNGSLILPLSICGTYVEETDHRFITNTIVIQQHPLIRTANDFEKSLICHLQLLENFGDTPLSLDQFYESHSLPLIEPLSDIELVSNVFHQDSTKILDITHNRLTIFHLPRGNIYNDFGIKSCIAHNESILDDESSVYQISNPDGCFVVNSEGSSSLTIKETDEGLMAYANMNNLGMESSDNFYLTCEIVFCKTNCRCPEIQQTEYPVSVISHKITKRSTDSSSEIFSLKQYETRTRFLKSTVKALMNSMMEKRKQNDKKSKIRKRLMRLDDSSFSEATSLGSSLSSTEIFVAEPVSTDISNKEPSLMDIDYDSDPENYIHDNYYDSYPEDFRHNYDSHPEDSHQDSGKELSSSTKFSTNISDMVVASVTESQNNGVEIVPDKELQEDAAVSTDDLVSPVNEATENTKIATTSIFPSVVNISGHTESCVPRMRFLIVIILMGFFIGCLLMASCGMALYIRKEKKRNRLNDFLLYSIGF